LNGIGIIQDKRIPVQTTSPRVSEKEPCGTPLQIEGLLENRLPAEDVTVPASHGERHSLQRLHFDWPTRTPDSKIKVNILTDPLLVWLQPPFRTRQQPAPQITKRNLHRGALPS
jgi:hypothetical protein